MTSANTGTPTEGRHETVRALIYHAARVGEIARALGGRDGTREVASLSAQVAQAGDADAAVRRLTQQVQRRAVRSWLCLSPRDASGRRPEVEALHAALLQGRARPRLIVPRALLVDEAERGLLRPYAAMGAPVRVSALSLPEMVVVDGVVAVLCEPGVQGAPAVVTDRPVIRALEALLDTVWVQSPDAGPLQELVAAAPRETEDGGTTLSRVLELLTAGWTDEAAARELGCSVRTYRRHVADLMRLLQARSRFQAGVRAAQRRLTAAL
ncbi:hypothetical protein GCM10027168_17570 [Streptomyces capparidis]